MKSAVRLNGLAVLGVMAVVGCYTYRPLHGVEPQVGTKVAFDVNDVGRVALGGTMGPEIAQIEGQLMDKDTTGYLMAVSNIKLLRGGEQSWSGEHVRVKPEYLTYGYERRFSMGRSVAFGAIGIGGFAGILITRSIFGSGSKDKGTPPDTGATARLGRP
jgi:hypothetical protein